MKKWQGAAGVCVNENFELLMVLEGRLDEEPNSGSRSSDPGNRLGFRSPAGRFGIELPRRPGKAAVLYAATYFCIG